MKGNTAGLVEAFKQGAEEAGHTVEVSICNRWTFVLVWDVWVVDAIQKTLVYRRMIWRKFIRIMKRQMYWFWPRQCITGVSPHS